MRLLRVPALAAARLALGLAVVLALLLPATAGTAAAHAVLLRSVPASGARLRQAPQQVDLWFDEPVLPVLGGATLRDAHRRQIAGTRLLAGESLDELAVGLPPLAKGVYQLEWRVLSDDGHIVAGIVAFGIGVTPPATGGGAPNYAAPPITVVGRWLFLMGVLLWAGTVARGPGARPLLSAATTLVALGGFFWALSLIDQTGAANLSQLKQALGTIGESAAGRALGAALLLLVPAMWCVRHGEGEAPGLHRVASVVGAAWLLATAAAGHTWDTGAWFPLAYAVDSLHLGAAAAWAGGLPALLLSPSSAAVGRFGRRLRWAAPVLGLTGIGNALFHFSAISQLTSTSYGQALLAKLAFAGLAAGVGVWAARHRQSPAAFRAALRLEIGLLSLALLLTAVLTSLPTAAAVASVRP